MKNSLAHYIQCFDRLKCAKTPVLGEAPHKPVLLLALIELFAKQELNGSIITVSDALKRQFEETWHAHVKTRHKMNLAMPFYHMNQEPFWRLVRRANSDDAVFHNKNLMKSLTHLTANIEHAEIDPALCLHLQNAPDRNALRQFLLARYFHKIQPLPEHDRAAVAAQKAAAKPTQPRLAANDFAYAQAA